MAGGRFAALQHLQLSSCTRLGTRAPLQVNNVLRRVITAFPDGLSQVEVPPSGTDWLIDATEINVLEPEGQFFEGIYEVYSSRTLYYNRRTRTYTRYSSAGSES